MKSMTGFGRSKLEENLREYIVEIKSVNHKYSDISIKMPRSISCFEENVKKIAFLYFFSLVPRLTFNINRASLRPRGICVE